MRRSPWKKDQVAVYSYGNELAEDFSINHMKFHVKERLDKFVMEDLAIYMTEAYYLVVADDQVLNQINDMQAKSLRWQRQPDQYRVRFGYGRNG